MQHDRLSTDPDHPIEATALRSVLFVQKPATEAALSHGVQALGFVVTTMVAGDKTQRVIEPRSSQTQIAIRESQTEPRLREEIVDERVATVSGGGAR